MTDNNQFERLSGSVERITFHSEETGFCVARLNVRGRNDLVTVVGSSASIRPGEYVEAIGIWINDRSYGLQFKASHIKTVQPDTVEGMEKYLGSGMVKGIGSHFAKVLVKRFKTAVFDIIENSPEQLLELPGIGPKRVENIKSAWKEQKSIRDIMVFLQSNGIGTARAFRIYKTYGDEAIIKVTDNPYRLALDIHGIGFKTADTIAVNLGIPKDSMIRAQAGVRHVLQEHCSEGHCACQVEKLVSDSSALLELDPELVRNAVRAEISEENLIAENIEDEPCVYLTPLYRAEAGVTGSVKRLSAGLPSWYGINHDTAVSWVEARTGKILSESQKNAVMLALKSRMLIITGGPGTGKTTLVNSILKILAAKKLNILLCAPTGRAAKRMTETTGMESKTIHRLLEFDGKTGSFKRNRENPLITDLLVIDESSMVDVVLMNRLLAALPDHAGVFIVGDVDQLPSVGPGSVLSDLIASETIPVVFLTEIFRQAASSRIIVNAHRINQGQMPVNAEKGTLSDFYFIKADTPEDIHHRLLQLITDRIPNRFGFDPVRDIQVLPPMNRGGLGVTALNEVLQKYLNPGFSSGTSLNPRPDSGMSKSDNGINVPNIRKFGTTFAEGDKIIQTRNNYDKDVYNGDLGQIARVDKDTGILTAVFDGKEVEYESGELDELSLAYAVSIHKSQGSEYPCVVIPLAMQHFMLLQRNLIYTGVTRGKKLVIIIGQAKALGMAVKNMSSSKRLTRLSERLAETFQAFQNFTSKKKDTL